MPLRQDELDALWDFGDPVASEHRFHEAALAEPDAIRRDELLTQVARALGLQDRFAEADAQLDALGSASEVAARDPAVCARVALERGRCRNSAGDVAAAVPLFEEAAAIASDAGLRFLHVDALHMLAITSGPDAAAAEGWTDRALALLVDEPDPRTRRWAVSLHNNLGWARFDAHDLDGAMTEFEAALEAARRDGTQQQVEWAREAIAECRTAMTARDQG
jgi:tetratricopeptide (TPR) repeat protein